MYQVGTISLSANCGCIRYKAVTMHHVRDEVRLVAEMATFGEKHGGACGLHRGDDLGVAL